jgi:hypothetical protein
MAGGRSKSVRWTTVLVAALVMLAAVSGCASSGGPAAYLGTSSTEVVFIQWQQSSSGHLQGTMTEDQASGTAPAETVSVTSAPFNGSANGSSVSLHFTGPLGAQAAITGTLNGNTLTLQIPQSSGTIQQDTFATGTVSGYNKALATLRNRIRTANYAEAQAQAAAKAQGLKAARRQAGIDTMADTAAQSACSQYGGSWSSPGTVDYNSNGYTYSIPDGPQGGACDNVAYLGSDDATYYVTISFSPTGVPQSAGSGTGTATASECSRGYYPDAPAGPTSGRPGNWSSLLGICLTSG